MLCTLIHTLTHTNMHTSQSYEAEMTDNSTSISSLGFIQTAHITYTHTHTHTCLWLQLTPRHIVSYMCTLVCLRTQTVLQCLFMNSSVCCRQAGDEDICSVWWYGHVFSIINLLSNLPSVRSTHLVVLYITYHETACRSPTLCASFVISEVCRGGCLSEVFHSHSDTEVSVVVCFKIDRNRAVCSRITAKNIIWMYRSYIPKYFNRRWQILCLLCVSSGTSAYSCGFWSFSPSMYGLSDSNHWNLHFSPWWEPGIDNASANRWVSVRPIICCLSLSFPQPKY